MKCTRNNGQEPQSVSHKWSQNNMTYIYDKKLMLYIEKPNPLTIA